MNNINTYFGFRLFCRKMHNYDEYNLSNYLLI